MVAASIASTAVNAAYLQQNVYGVDGSAPLYGSMTPREDWGNGYNQAYANQINYFPAYESPLPLAKPFDLNTIADTMVNTSIAFLRPKSVEQFIAHRMAYEALQRFRNVPNHTTLTIHDINVRALELHRQAMVSRP